MSDRTKKIAFAIFFFAFSIGMGYGLYWMFFRAQAPTVPGPTPEELAGQLPGAGQGVSGQYATPTAPGELPPSGEILPLVPEGPTTAQEISKIQLLRDGVTQAVSPRPDGNGARFYNPEDGRFYKITPDGQTVLLGDKQFFNVDTVSWGKASDQVVLAFPDGSKVYYDFDQKKQVTLPNHWEDFDFAPDDSRVVSKSIGIDPNNRFLITANPDGTEAKAVEPISNQDLVHSSWSPGGQIIAYGNTGLPQSENQEEIMFAGQNHENFKSIVVPGRGFTPNWSPTGQQILYSVWNGSTNNKPSLWISAADPANLGANRRAFNIQTWADKCTWASETDLYCGVPQNLPNNAGFSRSDFATLPDDVYHLDLRTGVSTKLQLPDLTHAIRSPVMNRDKSKLIFSDAATGKLYSYDVK
ncbi:hypothetical protein HZC53_02380 [Candidatus Uhrbacteria bacterium]|nr:hypothetical protein [Candidatus Uhrbacteria bacterium]